MKKLLASISCILVLVICSPTAWPGFDEGFAAYKRDDFGIALVELRPLAEQGHAEAQFLLGVMYEMGWGVRQDFPVAANWHQKAASQGLEFAEESIALLYRSGRGVPRNYPEALKWFVRAAEQGSASAQNSLGYMYSRGWGVPVNKMEAYKWYFIADSAKKNTFSDKAARNRSKISKRMTAAEISQAKRAAIEWIRIHDPKE